MLQNGVPVKLIRNLETSVVSGTINLETHNVYTLNLFFGLNIKKMNAAIPVFL
jgi:hypothetical protein